MIISPMITAKKANHTAFKGWSPVKKENKKQVDLIKEVLNDPSIKRVAVSGHKFPDEDSIGACFAMAYLMSKKTKQPVDIYIFGKLHPKFNFLKDEKYVNVIEVSRENQGFMQCQEPYDLAISMDTAETRLMKQEYCNDIFKKAGHSIKIDHHKVPDLIEEVKEKMNYADINFIDPESNSASQLVMQLVKPLGINPKSLPPQFNQSIYAGILGDTKNFNFARTSSPFNDTALLIKNGLNTQQMFKDSRKSIPRAVFETVSQAKSKAKFSEDNKIAYIHLDDEMTNTINSIKDENLAYEVNNKLKAAMGDLINIEDVEFGLMFSKRGEKYLHVSARSNNIKMCGFTQERGGGGHERAAGFTVPIEKNVEYTISKVLKEFQKLY